MTNATEHEMGERAERTPSLLVAAWKNRRWTRSSSSILLGLIPTVMAVSATGGHLPVITRALPEAGLFASERAPQSVSER